MVKNGTMELKLSVITKQLVHWVQVHQYFEQLKLVIFLTLIRETFSFSLHSRIKRIPRKYDFYQCSILFQRIKPIHQ